MVKCKSSLSAFHVCVLMLLALVLPATGNAEKFQYKVVYADVPGFQEILAGKHRAAIEILEGKANDVGGIHVADELATLCALYIVVGKLSAASVTCNDAVETDASDAAYNNRGVFRAYLGDIAGAMHDFKRVRVLPDNLQRYVAERMRGDARLVASNNFAVAAKHTANSQSTIAHSLADRVSGATVEEINY